jgi:hypothetical protein
MVLLEQRKEIDMSYKIYRCEDMGNLIGAKKTEVGAAETFKKAMKILAAIEEIICFEIDAPNDAADAFLADGNVYVVEKGTVH